MLCHHYKCIFIHIPKTAGQSIEHVFLNLLDLTWETRAPLLLRYNDQPELGPTRLSHLTANQYVRCKYITQEQFSSYFKFAFVRNPWDRTVSFYKYLKFATKISFNQFVKQTLVKDLWITENDFVKPQSDFVYDETGKLIVDFIGRFEFLQKDFNYVLSKIGLPFVEIPHINKSKELSKINSLDYENYYDKQSQKIIQELYKDDIKNFGYSFGK